METANDRMTENLDSNGLSAEVEGLKSSFGQLRTDVMDLLGHAFGVGKAGADAARGSTNDAVNAVKDKIAAIKQQGASGVACVEKKIGENPIRATLIAFGAGYVLAKMFSIRK